MSLQLSRSPSLAYLQKPHPIRTCHCTERASSSLFISRAVRGSRCRSTHRPSHGTASAGPARNKGDGSSYKESVSNTHSSSVVAYPNHHVPAYPGPGKSRQTREELLSKLIVPTIASLGILMVFAGLSLYKSRSW